MWFEPNQQSRTDNCHATALAEVSVTTTMLPIAAPSLAEHLALPIRCACRSCLSFFVLMSSVLS